MFKAIFLILVGSDVFAANGLQTKPIENNENINDNETCEFGMYNFDARDTPGDWVLITLEQLISLQDEFISQYNANGGITAIETWRSSDNCCFEIDRKGIMLTINNITLFPAYSVNKDACNDAGIGYKKNTTYIFYAEGTNIYYPSMNSTQITFGTKRQCQDADNPSIYATKACFN